MIILLLFTQVMNALVGSNTNLGKKLPKNDATITGKNDDATVNFRTFFKYGGSAAELLLPTESLSEG